MSKITGKKETIFDEAIKLISTFGFEAINLRQLAELSNIKASSVYNHFSSKQEILDFIYSYYIEHFFDNYKPEEEVKRIIESGSKDEIINALTFNFESDDIKKYERMFLISKIIYTRIFTDKRAAEIFFSIMMDDRESEIKRVLDYGISIGRFKPFDTKTFSSILCGSRHIMGVKSFWQTGYEVKEISEEDNIRAMLTELLPLKDE